MSKLTEYQIEKGFWYGPSELKLIQTVEEYDGSKQLRIAIPNDKELRKWISFLPTLNKVEYLMVNSNVNQKLFDAICSIKSLVVLYITMTTAKRIDDLYKLNKLKYLYIGNGTRIESIEVIGLLTNLKILELENIKKITNFEVISKLTSLEGLGICGSMWTAQKIDTLQPISFLHKLKYLKIVNTITVDKNFDPLLQLRELETFNSSWNYPKKEFEKLKELPLLKNSNVSSCLK